jgi:hypothetical protein
MRFSRLLAVLFLIVGCDIEPRTPPAGLSAVETGPTDDRWLTGSVAERNEAIERQLGGFSQSMWEVGYRYNELYWAARDGNWPLAQYQAEKIGDTIERGIERRPARAANARFMMLDDALPGLLGAIAEEDTAAFNAHFRLFTQSCNTCHEAEDVPFIRVIEPQHRLAPITSPEHGDVAPDVAPAGAPAAPGRAAGGR